MTNILKLRQGRKVSLAEYAKAKSEFDDFYQTADADTRAKLDGLLQSSLNYSSADPMNNRSAREYATQIYKNAVKVGKGEYAEAPSAVASTKNIFNGYSNAENIGNANYVTSRYLNNNRKPSSSTTSTTSSPSSNLYHEYNWAEGLDSGWTLETDTIEDRIKSFALTLKLNLMNAQNAQAAGKDLVGIDSSKISQALAFLNKETWTKDDFKSLMNAAKIAGVDPQWFMDYFKGLIPGVDPVSKVRRELNNQGWIDYNLEGANSWAKDLISKKGWHLMQDKNNPSNLRIYDKDYTTQLNNILEYNSKYTDKGVENSGYGHVLISDENGNVYLGDSKTIDSESPFYSLWTKRLNEDRTKRDNSYWDINFEQGKNDSETPWLQALEKKFGSFKGSDVSSLFQGNDKIFATGIAPGQSYYDKDDYFGGITFNNNAKFYKVGDNGEVEELSWDNLKDKFNQNGWEGEGSEQLGQVINLDKFLNEAGESNIDLNSDMGGRTFWTALLEAYGLDTIAPAALGAALGATAANGAAIGSYKGLSDWAMRAAAKNLGKDASEKAIKKEAMRIAEKALKNAVKKGTLKGLAKKALVAGGVRAGIHGALASTGIGALIGAALGGTEAAIRYANYDNINEDIPGFVHNLLGAVANNSGQLHTKLHGVYNNAQLLLNLDYNNKKAEYTKLLFKLFNENPDLWNQLSQQEKNTFIEMKRDFNRSVAQRQEGGVLKAAKGTVLDPLGEPLGEFSWENPSKTKAEIDMAKLREAYRKSNESGYGNDIYRKQASETRMFKGNGKMSTADALRISTMAQDAASIVASFVPGAGTGVAAGLGITALGTDLAADVLDPAVTAGEVAKNALVNAGFAGLGMIPGAKMTKVAKNIVKYAPKIITAAAGLGIVMDESTQATFKKLGDGTTKLNREDWRNLSHVLSLVAAGTRGIKGDIARRKVKKGIIASDNVRIKGLTKTDTNGKEIPFELPKDKVKTINEELGKLKDKKTDNGVITAKLQALEYLNKELQITPEQAESILVEPKGIGKAKVGEFKIETEASVDTGKPYDNIRNIWNQEALDIKDSSRFGRWFARTFGGGEYTAKQRAILEQGFDTPENVAEFMSGYKGSYNPMIDWKRLRGKSGATRMIPQRQLTPKEIPGRKLGETEIPSQKALNIRFELLRGKQEVHPQPLQNTSRVNSTGQLVSSKTKIILDKSAKKAAIKFARLFGIEIKSEKDYLRFIQDLKVKNPELYRLFLSGKPVLPPYKFINQAKTEYNFKQGGQINYSKLRK